MAAQYIQRASVFSTTSLEDHTPSLHEKVIADKKAASKRSGAVAEAHIAVADLQRLFYVQGTSIIYPAASAVHKFNVWVHKFEGALRLHTSHTCADEA